MNWLYVFIPTVLLFGFFAIRPDSARAASRKVKRLPPHVRSALHAYEFPLVVREVFHKEHPELSTGQQDLAFQGLKQYLMLLLLERQTGREKPLGMPSVLVDDAWHAFVLCTREYEEFCMTFFGQMVHHSPDPSASPGVLSTGSEFSTATQNTWSAHRSAIRKYPAYFSVVGDMPLLFGLDAYIGLTSGWLWSSAALAALDQQAPLASEPADASGSGCTGGSCTSFTSVSAWGDSSSGQGQDGGHSCSGHSCSASSCSGSSCSGSSCGSSCGSGCGGGGD